MAKDPAILFYTSDFLTGTIMLTHEQTGIYIRLLCILHQHGGEIDQESFNAFIGSHEILRSKFKYTEDGKVYQGRLMEEMAKRSKKSSSLSENAKKRWQKQCKSNAIAYDLHMPIEDENANEKNKELLIQKTKEVFEFFCLTLGSKILLSPERSRLIEHRLKEGRSMEELKKAIVNFSKDEWVDRKKFCDLVYAIGVRNKVDNLDRWLSGSGMALAPAVGHPKDCPECWGSGLVSPPGGKQVVCWKKY